jgi:CubicO group peptidase (beta-lactamase class C family)
LAAAETPIYSNVAFQLLAYALENITGRNFSESLQNAVLTPLSLNRTSYEEPDASVGVIPGTTSGTEWSFQMGDESP